MQINFNPQNLNTRFSGINQQYREAKAKAIREARADHVIGFDGALLRQAQTLAKQFAFLDLPPDLDLDRVAKSTVPVVYRNSISNPVTGQIKDIKFLFRPNPRSIKKKVLLETKSIALSSSEPIMSPGLKFALSRSADLSLITDMRTKSYLTWNTEKDNVFVNGCQSSIVLPRVVINPYEVSRSIQTAYKESSVQRKGRTTEPKYITQMFRLSPTTRTPGLSFALHHSDEKSPRAKIVLVRPSGKFEMLFDGPIE